MAAGTVVGRRDVPHAVGVGGELVALLETRARGVFRVVNRDGPPARALHHGEARNVGRPVAHVDHVLERDRAELLRHVVVHVVRRFEHPLVDAEEELRLLRVADHPFGEDDASVGVLRVFAAEDFAHVRLDAAAHDEFLDARADDVVLEVDAVGLVLGREQAGLHLIEHLRDAGEEAELRAQFAELRVGRTVHVEVVEQGLEVSQLVLVGVLLHQLGAPFPELLPVDAEVRENRLLLHIVRAEGLVVVVNYGDGALRDRHGGKGAVRAVE